MPARSTTRGVLAIPERNLFCISVLETLFSCCLDSPHRVPLRSLQCPYLGSQISISKFPVTARSFVDVLLPLSSPSRTLKRCTQARHCGLHTYVYSTELKSRTSEPVRPRPPGYRELCLGACHTSSRLIALMAWLAIFVGRTSEFPFLQRCLSKNGGVGSCSVARSSSRFYGEDHRSCRSAERHSKNGPSDVRQPAVATLQEVLDEVRGRAHSLHESRLVI